MNKISYLFVCSLFLLAFVIGSCKKYPDGPWISFRSRTTRMAHNWNVTSYKVNSVEQLNVQQFQDSNTVFTSCGTSIHYTETSNISAFTLDLTKQGSFTWNETDNGHLINYNKTYSTCQAVYTDTLQTAGVGGTWSFINKDKQLQLSMAGGGSGNTLTFDILELKEKEVKLSGSDIAGEKVEMTLKN